MLLPPGSIWNHVGVFWVLELTLEFVEWRSGMQYTGQFCQMKGCFLGMPRVPLRRTIPEEPSLWGKKKQFTVGSHLTHGPYPIIMAWGSISTLELGTHCLRATWKNKTKHKNIKKQGHLVSRLLRDFIGHQIYTPCHRSQKTPQPKLREGLLKLIRDSNIYLSETPFLQSTLPLSIWLDKDEEWWWSIIMKSCSLHLLFWDTPSFVWLALGVGWPPVSTHEYWSNIRMLLDILEMFCDNAITHAL